MNDEELNQAFYQQRVVKDILATLPDGVYKRNVIREVDRITEVLDSSAVGNVLRQILAANLIPKSTHEALFLSVHFLLLRAGYASIEEEGISSAAATIRRTDASGKVIPDTWNATEGIFTVVYTHSDVADSIFLLKALCMDDLLMLHIRKKTESITHSLELKVADYIKGAVDGYEYHVTALAKLLDMQIFSKLSPKKKPAVAEEVKPATSIREPVATGPPPVQPAAWNPMAILEAHREGERAMRSDIMPSFIGGIPASSPHSTVGPDHPMFRGGDGPLGPPGYFAPPGPPAHFPGARFDPFGPGVPMPTRGPRPNPTVFGEPDYDDLLPPGMSGPYLGTGRGRGSGLGPFGGPRRDPFM